MKFRDISAGRDEPTAVVEIEPTHEALVAHMQKIFLNTSEEITTETVRSKFYGKDEHTGWDTYSVLLLKSDGRYWLMGLHDGPLREYLYAV